MYKIFGMISERQNGVSFDASGYHVTPRIQHTTMCSHQQIAYPQEEILDGGGPAGNMESNYMTRRR